MATIDSLIDDLQAWTSVGSTRLSDAVAQECVNTAMRRLQRIHAWVKVQSVQVTIPTATGAVPLPPGFVREHTVSQVDTTATDPSRALTPLPRTTRHEWLTQHGQDLQDQVYPAVARPGASETQQYYIWDAQLVLTPTPSTATLVQLDYEPQTMDLTAGTAMENLLTRDYPDIVRDGGLVEAYTYLHELDRAVYYEQKFMKGAKEGITQREAATYAGSMPLHRGR